MLFGKLSRGFQKTQGSFARYQEEGPLRLAGIINCPGCPTLTGPDKLLERIRGLTDFRVDAIHFATCVKGLCLFREKLAKALREAFSDIKIGTHGEHISGEEFEEKKTSPLADTG